MSHPDTRYRFEEISPLDKLCIMSGLNKLENKNFQKTFFFLFFSEFKSHSKFQNPMTTPSGRKVTQGESSGGDGKRRFKRL